jgi:NhaP-type Na+/H+ or K+/H+ antiporter
MVLVESSLGGLVIGALVSYGLVRFFDRIPSENPMLKAVTLSAGALVIATIMTWGATSRLELMDAWRYFLLGVVLNVPRFVMLGLVVGYLYRRLYGSGPSRSSAEGVAAGS